MMSKKSAMSENKKLSAQNNHHQKLVEEFQLKKDALVLII
jgi:hypothetical protein